MEKLYSVEQRAKASFSLFKNESDDEESCSHEEDERSKTIYKKKFNKETKNLYSMEDSEDEEISENEENLFILETQTSQDDSNMEELEFFPQSVLTENTRIVMMKNLVVIRNIKRVKLYTRMILIKTRKTYIRWKIVKMKR